MYMFLPTLIASVVLFLKLYPVWDGEWCNEFGTLFGIELSSVIGYILMALPAVLLFGLLLKTIQISAENNTLSLVTILFDLIAIAAPLLLLYHEYTKAGIQFTAIFIVLAVLVLTSFVSLISDLVSIGLDG